MKKLGEFNFGKVDGKNEASNNNTLLLDTFFNYQGMYNKLEEGKFLILGNKGTGKTFLLEYFRRKKELEGDIFTDIHLEDFFSKKNIIQAKNDILDNIKLLKWIIYIQLSKKLLSLDTIDNCNPEVKKLKKFMKKNQFELKLDTNKIVESSIENGVKGNLNATKYGVSGFFEKTKNIFQKEEIGKYYEYIDNLEEVIAKILSDEWKRSNYIYIIFDELDNINDFNNKTYDIFLSLIKLSNDLNQSWKKSNLKMKILVGIREDIYSKLNATYTGKIKEDLGIVLGWGNVENVDSPLIKMIYHKMRAQDSELANLDDNLIGRNIFSKTKIKIHGKKISIYKYILGKTLLRPRDIISFFNKLQYKYGEKTSVTLEEIQSINSDYSEYLHTELRNQAYGILEIEIFDEMIKLLKNNRKTIFNYEELAQCLESQPEVFKKLNLKNLKTIISSFFEIGILGNMKTINGHTSKCYFKYKDDIELNFREELVVHYGIRPYLKLNIENELLK